MIHRVHHLQLSMTLLCARRHPLHGLARTLDLVLLRNRNRALFMRIRDDAERSAHRHKEVAPRRHTCIRTRLGTPWHESIRRTLFLELPPIIRLWMDKNRVMFLTASSLATYAPPPSLLRTTQYHLSFPAGPRVESLTPSNT